MLIHCLVRSTRKLKCMYRLRLTTIWSVAASATLHQGWSRPLAVFSLWSCEFPLCLAPDAHWLSMTSKKKMKCRVRTCMGFAVRDAMRCESASEKKKGGALNWLEPVSPWESRSAPIYQSEFQIRAHGTAAHPVRFISILVPRVCGSTATAWKWGLLARSCRF